MKTSYTINEMDKIRLGVLKQVKDLTPTLVNKYESAITPWLIRTVLDEANKLNK